jgi:hypothetical protein
MIEFARRGNVNQQAERHSSGIGMSLAEKRVETPVSCHITSGAVTLCRVRAMLDKNE